MGRPVTLGCALLVLLLAPARPATEARQSDASAPAWALLGPVGPIRVRTFAPSADWPADPAILALRNDGWVRTSDGGATWERAPGTLPDLAGTSGQPPISALVLARQADGARIALATTPRGVFRSPDFGTSWEQVLAHDEARGELVVSPTFGLDGTASYVLNGELYRSIDFGAGWERIEPAPGWSIATIAVSPAFASDHTVFAATVPPDTELETSLLSRRETTLPVVEDEDLETASTVDLGPGVLRSTDGGQTWKPVGASLVHEGLLFTAVRNLALSPTFAQDQTLFAVGIGPARTLRFFESDVPVPRMALFRSTDGGASWMLSQDLDASPGNPRGEIALSPFFAADGIGFFTYSSMPSSPASSGCAVWRTGDAGVSWSTEIQRGSYESCSGLAVGGVPGAILMAVNKSGLVQRLVTADGISAPPRGTRGPVGGGLLLAGTPGANGRPLFTSDSGGIWAWGPGARETAGVVPCAMQPVAGFGRVWQADRDVFARLGCPLEPERPVVVHVQHGSGLIGENDLELWLEDDSESWFALSRPGEAANVIAWPKAGRANRTWADAPDQVLVDGAVQHFEGGFMLFVPLPDGTRTIYAISTTGSPGWSAFPD